MRRTILILTALAALLGLAAVPAHATPTTQALPAASTPESSYDIDDCSQGQLCLFDTKLVLPGYHRYIINDYPSGFCFDLPTDWDNRTNRVNNLTTHSVTFYTGNSCNGALLPYPILPQTKANFNCCDNGDEANSVLFQGGSGCFSAAPCMTPVAYTGPSPTPEPGNTHNRQGFSSTEVSAQLECEELYGVCLYDNDQFQGEWYFLNVPTYISNFCVNLSGTGFNNRANSVSVNGPSSGGLKSSVRLWNRPDCEIGTRLDPPGKLYSPWLNSTMNNDITSSVRITVEAA